MKYTQVFWDWNGTLLNDVDASIAALNFSLSKRNMPSVDKTYFLREMDFPVVDFYLKLGFSMSEYELLAREYISAYLNVRVNLHDGVIETLKRINAAGLRQGILSASDEGVLRKQLSAYGISEEFSDILALNDVYAGSKVEIGRTWRRLHPDERVLMIGDSVHDFEVADALGFDCVLIPNGYNSKERLAATGARVVDSLFELNFE